MSVLRKTGVPACPFAVSDFATGQTRMSVLRKTGIPACPFFAVFATTDKNVRPTR